MSRLEVDSFHSLSLDDRRQEIDRFIASLSYSDLWYARRQIGDKLENLHSTLPDLPAELLRLTSRWLDPCDILRCRLVSRSWFNSWSRPAVISAVCRAQFPGLMETSPDSADVRTTWLDAVRRRCERTRNLSTRPVAVGFWEADRTQWGGHSYSYDDPEVMDSFRYCNGKMICQINDKVFIQDLASGDCSEIPHGNSLLSGKQLRMREATEELLIFTEECPTRSRSASTRVMLIRHRGHSHAKRLTLPGPFGKCYACGETVIIFTTRDHIIWYKWSGSAVEVSARPELHLTGHDEDPSESKPRVLLHPTHPDIFFLVWVRWLAPSSPCEKEMSDGDGKSEGRDMTLIVAKYEKEALISQYSRLFRRRLDISSADKDQGDWLSWHPLKTCRPANGHGSYLVALNEFLEGPDDGQTRIRSQTAFYQSVCFNVLTEQFLEYRYLEDLTLPNGYWGGDYEDYEDSFNVWNDEFIIFKPDHPYISRYFTKQMGLKHASRLPSEAIGQLHKFWGSTRYQLFPNSFRPCKILNDERYMVLMTPEGYVAWDLA